MKDYVFFIGPRKTGTTSFYEILRQADAKISPTVKESFFFDQEIVDLRDYKPRYSLDPNEPFAEISPSYFASYDALQNIHSNFPDAKIVITLRHPIKRAMSALSHIRRIGFVRQIWDDDCRTDKHVLNILTASNYQHYINRWSSTFPGNVCIIKQIENGHYDSADLEKVGRFIGVDIQSDIFSGTRANAALEVRSELLAKFVQKTKMKLANRGFFGTIRIIKKLKPILYRRQSATQVDEGATAFFSARLSKETEYFESLEPFSIR